MEPPSSVSALPDPLPRPEVCTAVGAQEGIIDGEHVGARVGVADG